MEAKINTVLIRFGELFLKGNNRGFFENALKKNIKSALDGVDCRFVAGRNRYYVEDFSQDDSDEIISRLTKVFGLHSISPALKVETDIEKLGEAAAAFSPKSGKFRVTVNRADKRLPMTSTEIAAETGYRMLTGSDKLTVDLFDYDFELYIDIRENGYSYLFYDKIPSAGGLPYGTGGKGMLLLSGGIDSPVAAYMMAKRGLKIYAVHYHSFPYTSELALQKVKDITAALSPYIPEIELIVVPFTDIQYAIHTNCPAEYMITLMRRFMMRIAERLAEKKGCSALITGESLGQVASQTVESINSTNAVVKMPVFRPLIGMDKDDIIAVSEKIGTYPISIRPYEDCCTVFLPKNPIIRPRLKDVLEYESKLDVEKLIEEALASLEKSV